MIKTNSTPTPLKMVLEHKNKYPCVFEKIDDICKDKGNGIPNWSDKCYAPIALTLSLSEVYPNSDNSFPHITSALAAWRRYKQIYSFDEVLYQELIKTETDTVLPIDLLNSLPYDCFYVETPDPDIDGFFVFYDDDCRGLMEFRLSVIFKNGDNPLALYIPLIKGTTIAQALASIREQDKANILSALLQKPNLLSSGGFSLDIIKTAINNPDYFVEYNAKMIVKLLQLVYYICSINADIQENPTHKETHRPINKSNIKDKFGEIQKWDVGFKVSKVLSHSKNNGESDEGDSDESTDSSKSRTENRKRPHTRKAHFHHYWVGSKDSRKLILKWVHTMFINADDDSDDNIIATINKIE